VNAVRPLLHELVNADPNGAVRRLAVASLRIGSPQRDPIVLLSGIAQHEDQDAELRKAAAKVAAGLTKRARER
ncbi:MAG: hypothetical protein ACRDN6_13395, partial [Gaiellaceae bacterium]